MRLTMVATVLMTTISAFGIHERKLHKGNFPCRLYTYSEEISDTVFEHTNGTPSSSIEGFPTLSTSGIYDIETEEQHAAFLKAHPDKLVVLKFYASYCRACKAMEPRFLNVKNDKQLNGLPIVWAECKASRLNKQFFKKLGVLALPTVHFYDGSNNGGLVENFQCGVNNIPLLKNKLATFLNTRVNPETLQLVEVAQPADGIRQLSSSGPRVEREVSIDNTFISEEDLDYLRNGLPFFTDLGQDDFLQLLKKAKLQSFNAGDIIIRQGEPGRKFYMMKSGLAEMSIKSRYADPISTPPSYLGAVVNQLKKYDYFGERALTTGEPYAASVRVLEKTRCFAFNVEDIPESCILSKQRRATQDVVDKLSQRYELPEDYYEPNFPASKKDENILELLVRFKQIRQAAKCFDYIMETDPDLDDDDDDDMNDNGFDDNNDNHHDKEDEEDDDRIVNDDGIRLLGKTRSDGSPSTAEDTLSDDGHDGMDHHNDDDALMPIPSSMHTDNDNDNGNARQLKFDDDSYSSQSSASASFLLDHNAAIKTGPFFDHHDDSDDEMDLQQELANVPSPTTSPMRKMLSMSSSQSSSKSSSSSSSSAFATNVTPNSSPNNSPLESNTALTAAIMTIAPSPPAYSTVTNTNTDTNSSKQKGGDPPGHEAAAARDAEGRRLSPSSFSSSQQQSQSQSQSQQTRTTNNNLRIVQTPPGAFPQPVKTASLQSQDHQPNYSTTASPPTTMSRGTKKWITLFLILILLVLASIIAVQSLILKRYKDDNNDSNDNSFITDDADTIPSISPSLQPFIAPVVITPTLKTPTPTPTDQPRDTSCIPTKGYCASTFQELLAMVQNANANDVISICPQIVLRQTSEFIIETSNLKLCCDTTTSSSTTSSSPTSSSTTGWNNQESSQTKNNENNHKQILYDDDDVAYSNNNNNYDNNNNNNNYDNNNNYNDDYTYDTPCAIELAARRSNSLEIRSDSITLQDITFLNGYSRTNGGNVNIVGQVLTPPQDQNQNQYEHLGGVVKMGSHYAIYNCHFSGGQAAMYGGNLYIQNARRVTIQESIFENGSSLYGGGVNLFNIDAIHMDNSILKSNFAEAYGGGLSVQHLLATTTPQMVVVASNFEENTSMEAGGAFSITTEEDIELIILNDDEEDDESLSSMSFESSSSLSLLQRQQEPPPPTSIIFYWKDNTFFTNKCETGEGGVGYVNYFGGPFQMNWMGNRGRGNVGWSSQYYPERKGCNGLFMLLNQTMPTCTGVNEDFEYPFEKFPTWRPTYTPSWTPTHAPSWTPTHAPSWAPTEAPVTTTSGTIPPTLESSYEPSTPTPTRRTRSPHGSPSYTPSEAPTVLVAPTPTPTTRITDTSSRPTITNPQIIGSGETQCISNVGPLPCISTFQDLRTTITALSSSLSALDGVQDVMIGICGNGIPITTEETLFMLPGAATISSVTLCCVSMSGGEMDGNDGECILESTGDHSILSIQNIPKSTLRDVTFRNGDAQYGIESGGNVAITSDSGYGDHSIVNCVFLNGNADRYGGNVHVQNVHSITIEQSYFRKGRAQGGGGLSIRDTSQITIHGCIMDRNNGDHGGGMSISTTTTTTDSDNDNDAVNISLIQNTFNNNMAMFGGAWSFRYNNNAADGDDPEDGLHLTISNNSGQSNFALSFPNGCDDFSLNLGTASIMDNGDGNICMVASDEYTLP